MKKIALMLLLQLLGLFVIAGPNDLTGSLQVSGKITDEKGNPLIGATGLSAVPMASRVANDIALKYDPKNHVLQYCMASNISGVIGSAVAAGVLISFLS